MDEMDYPELSDFPVIDEQAETPEPDEISFTDGKDGKPKKKEGALRPIQKVNRAIFRTLLIGTLTAGGTIILIILALNIYDNPMGEWLCRTRIGSDKFLFTVGPYEDSHTWVGNIDGSAACPIGGQQSGDAVWSPDEKTIAYDAPLDSLFDSQIFVMGRDGSNARQLSTINKYAVRPIWSPDGKRIVFVALDATDQTYDAYIVNADGSNLHKLRIGAYPQAWSPDGQKILFLFPLAGAVVGTVNFQLWIMNSNGHEAKQLVFPYEDMYASAWSHDGKHIAFSSGKTGNAQIYIMDVDGQNLKRLTSNTLNDYDPHFSRDDKTILFGRMYMKGNTNISCSDIYAINVDGTNQRRVTTNSCARNPTIP